MRWLVGLFQSRVIYQREKTCFKSLKLNFLNCSDLTGLTGSQVHLQTKAFDCIFESVYASFCKCASDPVIHVGSV